MAERNVVDILIRARNEASLAIEKATREIEDLERQSRQSAPQVDRDLQRIEERARSVGQAITRFGVLYSAAITAPLTALGVVGARSTMQLETFQKSLEVLVGDAVKAKQVFDELYEFDTQTTFDWPSLTKATRLLAAFQFQAEDIIPTLGRLGDIASGVNMNIDELAEIYGKARVQGRLFMEDVNQLTGRGIPVIQEFAKQFGVTEDAVRNLVSTGQINFGNLERAIVSLTSEGGKFHNLMQAQGDTTAGRLLQLRKEFEQVTDLIGAALIPTIDSLIARARAAVQWFVDLDEGQQKLIVTIGMVVAAVGPLSLGLGAVATSIANILKVLPLLRTAALAMAGPAGWVTLAVTAVVGLAVALAGRDKDSLTSAVEDAQDALASGDADSLVGALDKVIAQTDGPVKTALLDMQAELRRTGEVAVEMAEEYGAALNAALVQQAEFQVAAARAHVEAVQSISTGSATATPAELEGPLRDRISRLGRTDLAESLFFDQANNRFTLPADSRVGQGRYDYEIVQLIQATNAQLGQISTDHAAALSHATNALVAAEARLDALVNPKAPPGAGDPPPRRDPPPGYTAPGGKVDLPPAFGVGRALRYAEDAGLMGLTDLRALEAAADQAFGLWWSARAAATTEALRAGEDAGMMGREELQRLSKEAQQAIDGALNAFLADRAAVLTESLRVGEDAGTMGAVEQQRLAAEWQRASDHAFGLWWSARAAATTETLRAGEDAGLMGLTDQKAAAEAADRAVGEWFAQRIAATSESLRAGEDAGLMGLTEQQRHAREAQQAIDAALNAFLADRAAALSQSLREDEDAGTMGTAEWQRRQHEDTLRKARELTDGPRTDRVRFNGFTLGSARDREAATRQVLDAVLAAEVAARRELVADLTQMSSDKGPLGNFGAALLGLASERIPAFGAALDGFVQGGPIGALVAVFTELLGGSESFAAFLEDVNRALEPLVRLIGTVMAPVFTVLSTVLTGVVDALITIWNLLFGWIPGLRVDPARDRGEPPEHSDKPPGMAEVGFGGVSPAVQFAVATPLLEAAQLHMSAATKLELTFSRAEAMYARVEAFYGRVLEQGFRVVSTPPAGPGVGSSAVSRAAIVRG